MVPIFPLFLMQAPPASHSAPLTLYDAIRYPNARCLDGSPGGFYYKPGRNKNRWLFLLEGGGLCSHQSDCTARAKSALGSSHYLSPTLDFNSIPLMSNATGNPFKDWNLIFVPYCDGSMHSGQRTSNESSDVWGLYFSGHWNTVALIGEWYNKPHAQNVAVWRCTSSAPADWNSCLVDHFRTTHGLGSAEDLVLF